MSQDGFDSNAKRRLSLRGGASPEKKARNESNNETIKDMEGKPNPERLSDFVEARTAQFANNSMMDIDSTSNRLPNSATSSRFPQSTSANSSPPGSPRASRRSESRDRSTAPHSTQPRMMAPKWATSAPNEPEHMAYSSSSSRSSNRPHQQQLPQLSTSAPSQIPSPPSYNLSNGQPLVNPPLKTQAAFVGKLYAMLEDEDIARTGLIQWSPDGSVFTCPNPTEFAKQVDFAFLLLTNRIVLPRFFKHNNWQSFVRQLNMYSFNKVNDLFATSSDPQAWEFRHHLFRRGEPQLLAQIKRKSARPNQAESSGMATSPTEDPNDRIAGWMRPDKPYSAPSPPKDQNGRVFGYNLQTGETVLPRGGERPTSRGFWEARHHGQPGSSHGGDPSYSRLHPNRPPGSDRYGLPSPYSDPAYYPPAPGNPLDVSHRVAALEEHIRRLTATLNEERVDSARNHLHSTSSMLQMLNWVSHTHPPDAAEIRSLREKLNRQTYELQQHYETLMASDVLANLAGPRPETRDERPRMTERTLSAQHRGRSANFPDPRQPTRSGQPTSPRPTYSSQEPNRPLSLAQLNEGIIQHPLTSSATYSTSPFDHVSLRNRELHRRQTDGTTQPVDGAADRDRNRDGDGDRDKDNDEPMEEARGPSGLRNLLN